MVESPKLPPPPKLPPLPPIFVPPTTGDIPEPIFKLPKELPALPKPKLKDIFNPPDDINQLSQRLDTVAFGANHRTFFDAMLADATDAGMGIIPIFGDLLQTPRIANAVMGGIGSVKDSGDIALSGVPLKGPKVALQGFDTIIGIVPGIGDIIDVFTTPNMIGFVGDKAMQEQGGPMPFVADLPIPNEKTFSKIIKATDNPIGHVRAVQKELYDFPRNMANDLRKKMNEYPKEMYKQIRADLDQYVPDRFIKRMRNM